MRTIEDIEKTWNKEIVITKRFSTCDLWDLETRQFPLHENYLITIVIEGTEVK